MATSIYINTDLKDLTANAVANINRPTQVVRLPQIVEGEISDIALHLVKSNGEYDSRSGTAVDVEVSISAKGKSATSGTFKLNAGIESTGNLSWNASAEAVAGALNALNGGSGAYGSQVAVSKLANGSYRVIFDDVGERVDMAGQSIDLAPESTIGVSTSVVGSPSIRAQQVIEISQQPAIFSETWASAGSTWTGQLDANTARVQELIAAGADAFFEVKVGTDVVCQVPISILPSVAAPNSFPAHTLPDNLDAFAANPTTNGFFNPANWRADLNLVVGEDVQAWSTNLDEVAAKMSWNNIDKTFDIETGSNGVVIQVSQELLIYCRNASGVELVDGDVVKINGATGGRPNIEKAIADNVEDARSTIGVVTQTISNNSFGFIAIEGKVRGLSLPNGSFDEGDVLYLSDTTAGAFTKTEPDISVEIGHVVRTGNNNGELLVAIQNEASLYELKQLVGKLAGNNIWTGTNTFLGNDFTVQNEGAVGGTQTLSFTESDGFTIASEEGKPTTIGFTGLTTPFLSVDYTGGENPLVSVNEIQTGITPDDTKLCTSGAVVRFAAKHHPVTTFTGTNFETASKYTETLNALPSFAIEAVRIGSEVTVLSNSLFRFNTSIKYVDAGALPTIGSSAFRGCTALERVDIGFSNVIGQSTFRDCTALTEIDLGATRSLNSTCFDGCSSLEEITIPQTVTAMANYIFRNCTSLSLINCYITLTKFDGTDVLLNTASDLVIHARADDNSWTAGTGQSIAGNTNVEVIKDLY